MKHKAVSADGCMKAKSKLPAGFTDSRTSFDNARTFKIGVGYVSTCCFLKKRFRDNDTIIEITEVYGSLERLQWFFLPRNRPLDVIVDTLPQSLRLCPCNPTTRACSSDC